MAKNYVGGLFVFVQSSNSRNFSPCYDQKRRQDLKLDESKHKTCIECEEIKVIYGKGLCQ